MISVGQTKVLQEKNGKLYEIKCHHVKHFLTIKHIPNQCIQIQWVEEQHQVFAFVVGQFDGFEIFVDNSNTFKMWSRLLNSSRT